jgi:hypothetical protein
MQQPVAVSSKLIVPLALFITARSTAGGEIFCPPTTGFWNSPTGGRGARGFFGPCKETLYY